MHREKVKSLSGRNDLIERLKQSYIHGFADKITVLTGPSGSGKSYVLNKVLEACDKLSNLVCYMNYEDSFVSPSHTGTQTKLNNLSLTFSTGILSLGIGAGVQREETQYNRLKAMLRSLTNTTILFCIDDFSTANSNVKAMARILLSNWEVMEKKQSVKIYVLIADSTLSHCTDLVTTMESASYIELEPYGEKDILEYLKSKHLELMITTKIKQNISAIQKVCNGNLALANFLFADIELQNSTYFEALEQIVRCRLFQLKENGQRAKISETEMEDIVLSSALSVEKFTTAEISNITQRDNNVVANGLSLAQKDALISKDFDCYYDFCCPEVKDVLAREGIEKSKERLLYYYQYYTQHEQDEYYIRAYYLIKYFEAVTSQAFALLGLAFAGGIAQRNHDVQIRIENILEKYGTKEQLLQYGEIKTFYDNLSVQPEKDTGSILHDGYEKLRQADFEPPLRSELARSYFHWLYCFAPSDYLKINQLYAECLSFAKQEIALSRFQNTIYLPMVDESIVRLNMIYNIAPYTLDICNDVQEFNNLYDLSKSLATSSPSKSAMGLAQYIENIFNRKAFLFANPTQCDLYYDNAKRFFSKNKIWDELCLTLICQAGTNIVIQRYTEAKECCNRARQIAHDNEVIIPWPEKLQNNFLIAEFLEKEENSQCDAERQKFARQTIEQLKKQLHGSCSTAECVILTNICSLCLYCEDDTEYLAHKTELQQLMACSDVAAVTDADIDDFYRYYFAWFEVFRALRDKNWEGADEQYQALCGFVPALFQKQERFWEMKEKALKELITEHISPSAYDFCNHLVHSRRRENILSRFFCRGLMLSDLQYTSYN